MSTKRTIYTVGQGSEGNHIEIGETDDAYRLTELKIVTPEGEQEGPEGETTGSMSVLLDAETINELAAALAQATTD